MALASAHSANDCRDSGTYLEGRSAQFTRLAIGRYKCAIVVGTFAISILATAALVFRAAFFQPDPERFRAMVPRGGLLVMISAALGFALLNATMEELIWRGGIQTWLIKHTSVWLAILLQGLSFGALLGQAFPADGRVQPSLRYMA